MPYEKQKSESFEGFGGINTKVSNYITGLHECLDLQNFDFSRPGAWSQRWGSTLYFGQTLTTQSDGGGNTFRPSIRGIFEYENLNGQSQVIVNTTDAIYYGTGTSLTMGFSYQAVQNLIGVNLAPLTSYSMLNNTLFVFQNFSSLKFDGSTFYLFGTPNVDQIGFGITAAAGTSGTGYSGTITVKMGWVDIVGYHGNPSGDAFGASITLDGISFSQFSIYFDKTNYTGNQAWGLTALALYVQPPGSGTFFDVGDFASLSPVGSTIIINSKGSSATCNSVNQSIFNYPPARYSNVFFNGLNPNITGVRFSEIYNNQIFFAGLTTITSFNSVGVSQVVNYQSRLYWSEVGQPEFIDPTFFTEIRTNDGDRITGLKNYQNNLIIFKQRSFHTLFGNSATDISIQQVSDQYGCLSNKCAIVYNQQMLFLDRKGIIRWDGANITVASDKIEPIFARMNIPAAVDNAIGIHFKKRNEVWFGIPVDGSTLNNLTIVYDYIADAWTSFNGFVPSVFSIGKGRLSDYTNFYGSYTGGIFNFGSSLPSDNGNAITNIANSLFYRDMGNTVEKQWRRLFVDANIMSSGSTLQIDLIPDHGTSIYATRYMAMGTFQNRIDFGIPAKSLQFVFTYASATLPITINGITPESRYQRSV